MPASVAVRRCFLAPMDRLEVVALIAEDLCPPPPGHGLSEYQMDRYRNSLLLAVRWLCSNEPLPDMEHRELWAMLNLAEAAEIFQRHFPQCPQRAAKALAFAWERGGERVEMTTSSRERILAVLEDLHVY